MTSDELKITLALLGYTDASLNYPPHWIMSSNKYAVNYICNADQEPYIILAGMGSEYQFSTPEDVLEFVT